jgi:anti-anti-sigma regulatory factor
MEAAQTQTAPNVEQKLKIDKFSDGPVTCLKFVGTIDEQFDGKKIASTVKADILVVDLAEIHKISSFGIREWVDFITQVGQRVGEIVIIECAPKVVDQLNMVANFAGKGRVFSFYAPYRCDYCDSDSRVLLQIDKDFEAIKAMKPPERPCTSCGNPEYFDEDPTAFFSYLAGQGKFELDAGVASFLAAKLNYVVSDAARRLRAEKYIEDRSTYLKMAGDLDGSFPREKLAEGLEGTLVLDVSGLGKIDPAGAAEWRGFLTMITPTCEKIVLLGCPPVFLERLTKPEDLGPKAQVLSFSMPYSCTKCATTSLQMIDVEQHYSVLKFATPPEMKCQDCNGPTACAAAESLLSHLPTLPQIAVETPLRKFIKETQERKPEKPQVATTVAEAALAGRGASSMTTVLVAVAGAAVVASGIVFGLNYMRQQEDERRVKARDAVGRLKAKSADVRPDWIQPDAPRFSATCADNLGVISCVGVSSFAETQDDARAQATNAALEELTNGVGLKISDPEFGRYVLTLYGDARRTVLSQFDNARSDPDGARFDRARRFVSEGRDNVVAALRKSGGASVPAQAAAEYWEEYDAITGGGSRFLVYVQYSLNKDQVDKLISLYSTPAQALGAKVLTVFPGLAWRYPDVSEGAILVALGEGPVRARGVPVQGVVLSVRDRQVRDAATFASVLVQETQLLEKDGGSVRLVIKDSDGSPREFNLPIARAGGDASGGSRGGGGFQRPAGGGVNIWDRTGGGSSRDNPNE